MSKMSILKREYNEKKNIKGDNIYRDSRGKKVSFPTIA